MWWFDTCTYCEMFTTVRLLSTSFTSCNCHCCYCENILNLLIATFKYTVQYCHHGHQAVQGPFNTPKFLPLKIWNFCSPPLPHPQTLAAEILLCASMSSTLLLFSSVVSNSFSIPWIAAHQAPLLVGLPRPQYQNGLPFPSPGDLPHLGMEPRSSALQVDSSPLSHPLF